VKMGGYFRGVKYNFHIFLVCIFVVFCCFGGGGIRASLPITYVCWDSKRVKRPFEICVYFCTF
jgi:membrane protein required for beta-lactamase induction